MSFAPSLTQVEVVYPFGGALWHRLRTTVTVEFYVVHSALSWLGEAPETLSKKVYVCCSAVYLIEHLRLEAQLNAFIESAEIDLEIEAEQEAQREIQQEQIRAWERQAEEHEFELELIRQLAELSEFDDLSLHHRLEDFH